MKIKLRPQYLLFGFGLTVFFLVIVVGCTSGATTPLTQPFTSPTVPPSLSLIAPTQPPSSTSIQVPSLSASQSPTIIQIPPVKEQCIQVMGNTPPALDGQLVLSGFQLRESVSDPVEGPSFILNLLNKERSSSLGSARFETVSTDGNWLAFYDLQEDVIVITDNNGKRISEIPAKNILTPAYWSDSQHLFLNNCLSCSGEYHPGNGLVLINPFTSESHEWMPEFPNQDLDSFYRWQVTSNLVFNPTLTQLVYPIYTDGLAIALWDIVLEREIVRIYNGGYRDTPRWSPDGSSFVTSASLIVGDRKNLSNDDGLPYEGGSEILEVNMAGEVKRLTYFTTTKQVYQTNLIWSPDGSSIAFLQWDPHNKSFPTLMIVNKKNGLVTDYCGLALSPLNVSNLPIPLPDAIWSPDGQYVVFTEINEEYEYKVRLLEIESGKAWEIAKDVSAMGWMMNPK